MKKNELLSSLILLVLFSITFPVYAQIPEFAWSKSSGGLLKDYGNALTADSSGNIYVTGEFFSSSVDFGNNVVLTGAGTSGNCDFFLTKFDAAGNALWSKKGGGTLTDRGYGVVIDNTGNLVVTGHYYGTATFDTVTRTSSGNLDAFTAKYDTAGHIQWFKDGKDVAQSSSRGIAYDNHGNTVVIGYYGSSSGPTITFDDKILTTAGQRDIFLVKYNAEGVVQWAKSAGGTSTGEEGKDVACDADGNIYVTGMFADTATFGTFTLYGNGSNDIFVAKYSPQGDVVWAKNAGGPKADVGYSIALDQSGNIFVGGYIDSLGTFGNTTVYTDSMTDAFVAKYDNNGTLLWVMTAGGKESDNCSRVIADAEGNCLAFGNFRSTFDTPAMFGTFPLTTTALGYDDLFFMKISPTSQVLWVKQAGGDDNERITNVALNAEGNILTTGYYKRYLKIGGDSLVSIGNEDIFLSQLGSNSVPVELTSFSVTQENGNARLSWTTATEKNNSGFEIQKSTDKTIFTKVSFVKGQGTTIEKSYYSFIDNSQNSQKCYYRLKQIDFDGTFTYSDILEFHSGQSFTFVLDQNYPNPFNPETKITFTLSQKASVHLKLFNILGEQVATLINERLNTGKHVYLFNASQFSSGVYLYQLSANNEDGSLNKSIKKMILTK